MIAFTVHGDPQTKGSAKAFVAGKTATGKPRVVVKNDNDRCKAWQEQVAWKAKIATRTVGRIGNVWLHKPPTTEPVRVEAVFRLAKPRTSKLTAPRLDVDKLLRALLDGMTGIVYVDDKQVVEVTARKEWGEPGVDVRVVAVSEPERAEARGG